MQPSEVGQPASTPPVFTSIEEAVAAVQALLPEIQSRAAETDRTGRVPQASIQALEEAGLFGILTPKAYGGSALGWQAFYNVVAKLGTACGSTAWVYGVLTGHNHMLTRFPESVQKIVLTNQKQHISVVFRLSAPWIATPNKNGGYTLNGGQGKYCSGVEYSQWVGINAIIESGPHAGQLAFCLIETSKLQLLDDWNTLGMRGTQSRSIIIENIHVDETLVALATDLGGPAIGPAADEAVFYSWPYFALAPFAICGAPIGVAQGMLQQVIQLNKNRLNGLDDEMIAANAAGFARLSDCEYDISTAFQTINLDTKFIDQNYFSDVTPLELAKLRRNLARAPQDARYAAVRVYENAGAQAIYKNSEFERMFRDINAGSAHYAFTADISSPNYGRALVGLPPAKSKNFV